jgi:autotransporter adhesin
MTLNNNGATFSNTAGNPIQVHGVANGTSTYDAVNYGQLQHLENRMSGGIAGTAAIAMIPPVDAGKQFSLGLGAAGYNGEAGIAAGAGMRFNDNLVARIGVGVSPTNSGGTQVVGGGGISYSW